MHEYGLCEGVVAAIEKRAEGRPVERVGVRVGARHKVVPEAFEQAFSMVATGTVADGADLEVVSVPVAGRCAECGRPGESVALLPTCEECGGGLIELQGGDDLMLEWIRYRDTTTTAGG